MHKFM